MKNILATILVSLMMIVPFAPDANAYRHWDHHDRVAVGVHAGAPYYYGHYRYPYPYYVYGGVPWYGAPVVYPYPAPYPYYPVVPYASIGVGFHIH